MINAQSILEILDRQRLRDIREELGPQWPDFCRDLAQLREVVGQGPLLRGAQPEDKALWQVCCRYPFVKGFILGYYAPQRRAGPGTNWRQVEAGGAGYGDNLPIKGIANRFHSLLMQLEKMNQQEETVQGQPKEDERQLEKKDVDRHQRST